MNKIYISKYNSKIGEIRLKSDGKNLTMLAIEGQDGFIYDNENYEEKDDLPIFINTKKWLDEYFTGKIPNIQIPLKLEGTEFRKEVWEILQSIPYGKTITYGEIAESIAEKHKIKRMSAQAVGNAVGSNPISIIVPCHRVIGKNKKLTGYNGGINLKKELLNIEKIEYIE